MRSVLALLSLPLAVRGNGEQCTSSSLGCVLSAGAQSLMQVMHKQEQVSTAKSLDNALTLVEGLAEKEAETPTWDGHNTSLSEEEKTALQTIKSFIDDLFATMSTGHTEDQAEVNRSSALVQVCTDNTKTGLDGDVDNLKGTAATKKGGHGGCRAAEIIALNNRTNLCYAYDMHRQTAGNAPPICMLTDLTNEMIKTSDNLKQGEMENCLESTNTWLNALYDFYLPCSEARVTYTNKVAECWTKQTEFEGAFCVYEAKLVSTCDNQDSCRLANVAAYEDTVKDVKVSENARVADHKVGQKIRCLFGVFEASNADKPGKLTECKEAMLDNLPKEIVYPPTPDAQPCDREQDWPCKAAWTKAQYDDATWWNSDLDMNTCKVCTQYAPQPVKCEVEALNPEGDAPAGQYFYANKQCFKQAIQQDGLHDVVVERAGTQFYAGSIRIWWRADPVGYPNMTAEQFYGRRVFGGSQYDSRLKWQVGDVINIQVEK